MRRAPEIGLDHPWITADLRRGSLGEQLSEAHAGDAIAESHDRVHVMLDQKDGNARIPKLSHQDHHALGLLRVHSGERLVQHDEIGVRCKRHRHAQ
jgi:hypothetical protein